MEKVVNIRERKPTGRGRLRRLEEIKHELFKYHGVDLDELMASEPATSLTIAEFEDLTQGILGAIDNFCEIHPKITVHDVLYTLENVKEIIRENSTVEDEE
ncbi:MAG TPA: hypothetical protein EYP57_06420 [Thermodesulfobacteriaceae bacterium]|nr:hypothetical protein [Thermodesulfobacteriaceae bacterium]